MWNKRRTTVGRGDKDKDGGHSQPCMWRSCTMAGPEDPHFNIIVRIRELMRRDWRQWKKNDNLGATTPRVVKGENSVCRLNQSLYGLKQASRNGFAKFASVDAGFLQSQLIASTYRLSAKSLSGSSYYIPSLLSISTVDAIEALNAISGGENIPAATIVVDGTSSVRVRALAGITSASYLTVGGETTVRNVHKPSSTKAGRSVLVSPKRRKEGHERHREDSRTRHDSHPGKFDLHWPCCPQIDYSPLKVKPILRQVMVSGIGHRKGRIEECADQFNFSFFHLEIVCLELGYGVGRECQYISSSSSKAKISINSIILPLFASEAVSSLSRSSRSSKRSLLIPILLKEEVNRSRFLRTSVMERAGLLFTDIRSGIQNRGKAALLILLLMERHKNHPIKHARSLSKPLLAYQARPVRTSPQFSILIELGRIALQANNLLTLSLQAPWSHLSPYSIVLFGMERKRSAFCRKNRSKARYGPSLPLRHPPPCPIHSPEMSTRNLKKKDKEIQLEISCP
ncbi:hypothetical protein KY284_010576 [Solanum tuberosum]|nr:hypothetical protein KY284_010576 [Solanum tuberosum]